MNGFQQLTIIGTVAVEPEMQYGKSGKAYTKLTVVVNSKWKSRDGNMVENADWYEVVLWEGIAEALAGKLHKGSNIHVVGIPKVDAWMADDGEIRTKIKINVGGRNSTLTIAHWGDDPYEEDGPDEGDMAY